MFRLSCYLTGALVGGGVPMLQVLTRTDFVTWLRTGRRPVPDEIELKFNPWHDPRDGRFTFVGSGRFYGWMQGGFTGGGGGSAGGGGASGSWEPRKTKAGARVIGQSGRSVGQSRSRSANPSSHSAARPIGLARLTIDTRALGEPGPMWSEVTRNGYSYRLDGVRRTMQAEGTLVSNPDQRRSRNAQITAGGQDRLPTDHGGHYIARRFNGPTDAFNHFAQDAKFNAGAYRALEDRWAAAISHGREVRVVITPRYAGASLRPSTIAVWYSVDGIERERMFQNATGAE